LICLSFVIDADDARDKMNDDGDETPGMLHVVLLSLFSCYISTVFLLPELCFGTTRWILLCYWETWETVSLYDFNVNVKSEFMECILV